MCVKRGRNISCDVMWFYLRRVFSLRCRRLGINQCPAESGYVPF